MNRSAPALIPDLVRRARECLRAGDNAGAETAFVEVLAAQPRHPHALHMLGLLAQKRGDLAGAVKLLEAAAGSAPDSAEIQSHLGEALRAAGEARGAVAAGRRATMLAPEWPPGLNNLGLALQADGESAEAESIYRRLVKVAPQYPRGHYNLGNLLNELERPEEAEPCLRRALSLKPDYFQSFNALGAVMARLHRPDEAEAAYRRALEVAPRYAKAWYNLGNLLADRQRSEEALQCLDRALGLNPEYREALLAKGALLTRLDGRYDEGLAQLQQAANRFPDHRDTWLALAEAFFTRFDFAAAARAYAHALEVDPVHPEARANLILCRAEICDWHERDADITRLRELVERQIGDGRASPLSPHGAVFFPMSDAEKLAIARRRSERIAESVAEARRALGDPAESGEPERLRIGYLSSDFRENALAHLTGGLYGLHDRERFEVFGYSLGPDDGSEYRQRIASDCDRFADLRQATDVEVARRIRDDGIHMLVDLVGYAGGARPGILAMRPAPVQVIWLYPGSMGGVFHDYMIGDRYITQPARAEDFGERLVLMPDSYQVTDHEQPLPAPGGCRADHGLPAEAFVFCSFNAHAKIDPAVFNAWMRLLDQVPGSVIWLLALSKAGRENLRSEATSRGIDPGRLVFGKHAPRPMHLQRLALADLALDTWVCNGHTTTSDALWAGLPVVTRAGDNLPARVSESLLTAAGLDELVAADAATYESLALGLASEPGRLAGIRERVAAARRSSALFDSPRFVRQLEAAYRSMWQHRDDRSRQPISVAADSTGKHGT